MISKILSALARVPGLALVPCPQWVARALAEHQERQQLVMRIRMLPDGPTTFAAVWLARVAWLHGHDIDDTLRGVCRLLARGGR